MMKWVSMLHKTNSCIKSTSGIGSNILMLGITFKKIVQTSKFLAIDVYGD